jgi:hypothetical protein
MVINDGSAAQQASGDKDAKALTGTPPPDPSPEVPVLLENLLACGLVTSRRVTCSE